MEIKTISKNRHYRNNRITGIGLLFMKNNYKKSEIIKFNDSCLYKFGDEDDYDVNKLFGFSNLLHHRNSFRFGWNVDYERKLVNIYAYYYINGIRNSLYLTSVELYKDYRYEICYDGSKIIYKIILNNNIIKIFNIDYKVKNFFHRLGYKLDLYFGGNKKSPNDMYFIFK